MGGLTESQIEAIGAVEITCSVFSLLGSLFIITTFCFSHSFHKPINRMVFYASFGNMMTNVGTLMSRTYVDRITSFGCQFQAFLLQLFWPADALWTLAMAINVYLTFYYKFDAKRLRRMEIPYLIACYGIPFVPAIVLPFIREQDRAPIFGNATLWCWISYDWGFLRISALYGPVWVVNLITFSIYIRAGRTIYTKHKQLRDLHSDHTTISIPMKTVEITVTTKATGDDAQIVSEDLERCDDGPSTRDHNDAYTVHISAGSNKAAQTDDEIELACQEPMQHTYARQVPAPKPANIPRRRHHDLNRAALAYTKCSILFFLAMLITWIPSSANRLYSLLYDNRISIPLTFMAAFVLPLQGFWNAVIYIFTSWSACVELFQDLKVSIKSATLGATTGKDGDNGREPRHEFYRSHPSPPANSSESVTYDTTMELTKAPTKSDDGSHCY